MLLDPETRRISVHPCHIDTVFDVCDLIALPVKCVQIVEKSSWLAAMLCGSQPGVQSKPLMTLCALCFLQCFDTDDWRGGRKDIRRMKIAIPLIRRSYSGTGGGGRPKGEPADPGSPGKQLLDWSNTNSVVVVVIVIVATQIFCLCKAEDCVNFVTAFTIYFKINDIVICMRPFTIRLLSWESSWIFKHTHQSRFWNLHGNDKL